MFAALKKTYHVLIVEIDILYNGVWVFKHEVYGICKASLSQITFVEILLYFGNC